MRPKKQVVCLPETGLLPNIHASLYVFLVEKDKTGVWLAEQLGVTAVTVSNWCSNITQPTLPTLDRIAELLECEKRELITE